MEMSEEIYINAEVIENKRAYSNDSGNSYEDVYANQDKLDTQRPRNIKQSENSGGRCYRVTLVCMLLLCALLLTAVTVLWIKFTNLNTEKDQLQTSNNDLTKEREQLQTSNNYLTQEREKLQTSYNNLTKERDECQSNYMLAINGLVKLGWRIFSSSIYYISLEGKSWTESRQYCRESGGDVVIINRKEEQEFIIKQMGNNKEAWIGLSDIETEEKWKWVDGTELTNSTEYWYMGEPNNDGGNEDCGEIRTLLDKMGWNDRPCSLNTPWICEKKVF